MRQLIVRCGAVLLCALLAAGGACAATRYHPEVRAGLVEIQGHQVWGRDTHRRLPQASLTKIMTALLILDHYRPNAVVTVSRYAASVEPSKIGLHAGDRLRVSDLLAAMLIHSANDACRALAQWRAGSETKFVARMNARARQLGLRDTHFANACGFDARGHYSSAHDVARLAALAMRNRTFSRLVDKTHMTIRTVDGRRRFHFHSTNALLGEYRGARGVKTGYTAKAGPCLVAISQRKGVRVMIVMLNARDRWDNARRMFDRAFGQARRLREERVAAMPERRVASRL